MNNIGGMSLIEVLVALIVIGVLLVIAIPKFNLYMDLMEVNKQRIYLKMVYDAQVRYQANNACNYFWSGNPGLIGLEIQYSDTYWDPSLGCGGMPTCNPNATTVFPACPWGGNNEVQCGPQKYYFLATVDAMDTSHKLYLLLDGRIVCLDSSDQCEDNICTDLRFEPW